MISSDDDVSVLLAEEEKPELLVLELVKSEVEAVLVCAEEVVTLDEDDKAVLVDKIDKVGLLDEECMLLVAPDVVVFLTVVDEGMLSDE